MTIIDHPSPNHSARKEGVRVDTIVLHHTGVDEHGRWSDESALNTLCNPSSGVSAHYLVETGGRVLRLVPEDRKAWHAGLGCLPWERGETPTTTTAKLGKMGYDFNHRSIGIELVNPGDGVTPFTEAQYLALEWLLPGIVQRLRWTSATVATSREVLLAHDDDTGGIVLSHRDIAPGRKTDPADNFDWDRVRKALAGGVA